MLKCIHAASFGRSDVTSMHAHQPSFRGRHCQSAATLRIHRARPCSVADVNLNYFLRVPTVAHVCEKFKLRPQVLVSQPSYRVPT